MLRALAFFLLMPILSACIGEDIVEDFVAPELRLTTPIDSLTVGDSHQFTYSFFNNIGAEEEVAVAWSSSNPDVLLLESNGLATAVAPGTAAVTIRYEEMGQAVADTRDVVVTTDEVIVQEETRSGRIGTTSQYLLEGDFTLRSEEGDLVLEIAGDYRADTDLPGLYVYLTNNTGSVQNALEIARVTTFSGAHEYRISDTGIDDFSHVLYFCKPFNVKVGDGEIIR